MLSLTYRYLFDSDHSVPVAPIAILTTDAPLALIGGPASIPPASNSLSSFQQAQIVGLARLKWASEPKHKKLNVPHAPGVEGKWWSHTAAELEAMVPDTRCN
jgi:hypothetical protein